MSLRPPSSQSARNTQNTSSEPAVHARSRMDMSWGGPCTRRTRQNSKDCGPPKKRNGEGALSHACPGRRATSWASAGVETRKRTISETVRMRQTSLQSRSNTSAWSGPLNGGRVAIQDKLSIGGHGAPAEKDLLVQATCGHIFQEC